MRIFANLFLILFLADGSISILDELVHLIAQVELLGGVRSALANTVILMAIPLYLCLGIDRRLPKLVFLPLIVFVAGCPLTTWVFPALAGSRIYGLLTAVAQLALLMLPLSRFRKGGEQSLTMPPEMFAGPVFSLKNTLGFCGANLAVIPLALLIFVLASINAYMAENTSGFMRLGPGGLSMIERVYRRDNRTIRLAGMIHVGEKEYYDELVGSVAPGRTIVLAEGVTDDRNLLPNRLDYGRVADFLGLASQETMEFKGRAIEAEELEMPLARPQNADKKEPAQPADILRADVDVSAFRPPTILLLDTMGKYLKDNPSLMQGLLSLNSWAQKNITPEMNEVIMDDILYRRNQEVIRHMGKAIGRYDTIVIPWGALHMKEIEAEVLKLGFRLQEERQRLSIDFRKMLLETL